MEEKGCKILLVTPPSLSTHWRGNDQIRHILYYDFSLYPRYPLFYQVNGYDH